MKKIILLFASIILLNACQYELPPKTPENDHSIDQAKTIEPAEEKPKPDFCRLITNDSELGRSFVFEKPDFKRAEISHTFLIEQIDIPKELKSSDDFSKIREQAKRKGKIIREAVIDGQEIKREIEFEA